MFSQKARTSFQLVILSIAVISFPAASRCQDLNTPGASSIRDGKTQYTTNCSGCHGTDGVGTGHAPKLADNPDLRGRSLDRLRSTIAAGFPASGMPPFAGLPARDLDLIAMYVRSLNSPAAEAGVAGDAAAGEQFFWGKGRCGACHMVHGMGSPIGPDLSDVGRRMTADEVRNVLLSPDLHITPGYQFATVKTRNGQSLRGFMRNRSNYDLQLQDLSGSFHLLQSEDIVSLTEDKESLMRPLSATADEFQNLSAYLDHLTGIEPGPLKEPNPQAPPQAENIGFSRILNPKPGDWPTYNGNLDGNRYSPLKQIDPSNVKALALRMDISYAPAWPGGNTACR